MCEYVSFKCVYKGILAEGDKRQTGFTYHEMMALVPHNNSAQFSRQFWDLASERQNAIFYIQHNKSAVFMTAKHAAPAFQKMLKDERSKHEKTLEQLESAQLEITELKAKLEKISHLVTGVSL